MPNPTAPNQHFLETHEVVHGGKPMATTEKQALLDLLNTEKITITLDSIQKACGFDKQRETVKSLVLKNRPHIKDIDTSLGQIEKGGEDGKTALEGLKNKIKKWKLMSSDNKEELLKALDTYNKAIKQNTDHNKLIADKKHIPARVLSELVLKKGLSLPGNRDVEKRFLFLARVVAAFGELIDARHIAQIMDKTKEKGNKDPISTFIQNNQVSLNTAHFRQPAINIARPDTIRPEYELALSNFQTDVGKHEQIAKLLSVYIKGDGQQKELAKTYRDGVEQKTKSAATVENTINNDQLFTTEIAGRIQSEDDPEKTKVRQDALRHRKLITKREAMEAKRKVLREMIEQLEAEKSTASESRFELTHYRSVIPALSFIPRHKKALIIAAVTAAAVAAPPLLYLWGGYKATAAVLAGAEVVGGAVALGVKAKNYYGRAKRNPMAEMVRLASKIPGGLTVAKAENYIMEHAENMFAIPGGVDEHTLQKSLEKKERTWKQHLALTEADLSSTNREMTLARVNQDASKLAQMRAVQQQLMVKKVQLESYYNLVKSELDQTKKDVDAIRGLGPDKGMGDLSKAASRAVEENTKGGITNVTKNLPPEDRESITFFAKITQANHAEILKKIPRSQLTDGSWSTDKWKINDGVQLQIKQLLLESQRQQKWDAKDSDALPYAAHLVQVASLIPGYDLNNAGHRLQLLRLTHTLLGESSLF